MKRINKIPGTSLENDKWEAFVHEYRANGRNATWAYINSYKANYETARTNGPKLLQKAEVKVRLFELDEHDSIVRYRQIENERIQYDQQLARIAFHKTQDIKTADALVALKQLNENRGFYKQEEGTTFELKINNLKQNSKNEWIGRNNPQSRTSS